jgi:hypothetical protein
MQKPNPSLFLNVMKEYLNRLSIKKIIPIEYENAKMETYYDMLSLVPSEQQELFKKALSDFESITDIKSWYQDEEE